MRERRFFHRTAMIYSEEESRIDPIFQLRAYIFFIDYQQTDRVSAEQIKVGVIYWQISIEISAVALEKHSQGALLTI